MKGVGEGELSLGAATPDNKAQKAAYLYEMLEELVGMARDADELETAALLDGILNARDIRLKRQRPGEEEGPGVLVR